MQTDADVIVAGGGLAGLAAAATAARAGSRVLLLEAHHPGGRARSVERDGYILNRGAHALFVGGPGQAVLRSLGVAARGAAPPLRQYRALSDGRLHPLPTGPTSFLRTGAVGARGKAQLIRLLARMPRLRTAPLATTPVAAWLADARLRPDAESVVRALIRLATYTADVDDFSADAALSQLQLATAGGVLYLDGGWSQLVDALAVLVDVRTGTEVTGVDRVGDRVEVRTSEGVLLAHQVVVATGTPAAVQRVLPVDPGWGELGPPLTAACLDLGVERVPDPGYVLSLDGPLYVTVQSPPARQAPPGHAVVAAIRYGARSADEDRPELERMAVEAGVVPGEVVTRRFLAHLPVAGAVPRAGRGGLAGRPGIGDTGVPGVVMAGDWVGPAGLLADAALASGSAAGRLVGGAATGPAPW